MARATLLCAKGTVPIEYGGGRYNIRGGRRRRRFSSGYHGAVTPTREMIVKANHACVEADGEVVLERLMTWNARSSSMREVGERMAEAFSAAAGVFEIDADAMATATNGEADTGSLFASSSATATSRYPEINLARIRPRVGAAAFRGDGERVSNRRESADDESEGGRRGRGGQLFRDRIIRSLTARLRDEAEARLGVDVSSSSRSCRDNRRYEKRCLRQSARRTRNCARDTNETRTSSIARRPSWRIGYENTRRDTNRRRRRRRRSSVRRNPSSVPSTPSVDNRRPRPRRRRRGHARRPR